MFSSFKVASLPNCPKAQNMPVVAARNYKYFDQLLQTVKNKTTVLNLSFKEFLQTSISPLICVFCAKGYHNFPLKNFGLTVPKKFVEAPFYFGKFLESKKITDKRGSGNHVFPSKSFRLTTEAFHRGTLLWCVSEIFW